MKVILVIEDDEGNRENISEILMLDGYDVLTAADGSEGIVMASTHLPNLILCDILMPLTDGYEVLLNVRSNLATLNIPFIFISASSEKKEIQKAIDSGANGYLCKPFEPVEMLEVIKECLA